MSRRNSKRWVYVVGSPAARAVKIGVSNDPRARLADLQVGSPVPLLLLWKTPGGQGLESALHAYFAPYRTHGEWFDFQDEDPVALVATAAVLMGHRAQPKLIEQDLRYRVSNCTACAARRVSEATDHRKSPSAATPSPAPRPTPPPPEPPPFTNRLKVLTAVRQAGGPVRQKTIVEMTGIAKGTVSREVQKLVTTGVLRRSQDGALTIASPPPGHSTP
ncbi:GIY-YIG nuclease family protein [Streptomyces sp. NPDC049577]|uniref:GIY-YIG nuclease family protein n=1 Tax=Streptomyces sp. NPDC049577 TaxID=3155153 RepID=UPI003448D8C8